MAAAHSGYITLKCHMCTSNSFVRALSGCDQSLETIVETIPLNETLYEYFNCPSKFIPENISNFISMYQFGIEFGGIGDYNEINNKFIDASSFYKSRINHFQAVQNG